MARVSKRKVSVTEHKQCCVEKKAIKAGIYARLSSDQDERKNASIDSQFEIARQFVDDFNTRNSERIEIVEYYADLGKTGTSFKRNEFQRLLQDIRLGDINCVIVKDLSRFGRNYLEAGNYIEKIFPFLGVRFIAVTEGFDTGVKGNESKQLVSEIKNLINDMYAKDFSVKARVGLKQRREEGSYVGGPPPYGYKAVFENKIRKLVPDDNTAEIVRLIFESFVQHRSYASVLKELHTRRINPPTIYKKTGQAFFLEDSGYKGWEVETIKRILSARTYTGDLVQGKTSITAKNEKNRIHKDESEWVTKINTHAGVVSKELFEQAQDIRKEIAEEVANRKHHSDNYPIEENIFDDVFYCGVCGKKMTRTSRVTTYADGTVKRVDAYLCPNGKSSKVDSCPTSNTITKDALVDILSSMMQIEFKAYLEKAKSYKAMASKNIESAKVVMEKEQRRIEVEQTQLEGSIQKAYMNYRNGNLEQKDFVAVKLSVAKKQEEFVERLRQCEERKKDIEKLGSKYIKAIGALPILKNKSVWTKDMVDALIERLYLYPGKRIEVFYQFSNDMLEGLV